MPGMPACRECCFVCRFMWTLWRQLSFHSRCSTTVNAALIIPISFDTLTSEPHKSLAACKHLGIQTSSCQSTNSHTCVFLASCFFTTEILFRAYGPLGCFRAHLYEYMAKFVVMNFVTSADICRHICGNMVNH